MLMAFLKGKISLQQTNMEDMLTSNVFGIMKYLPPFELLLPFLAYAVDSEERPLLNGLDETSEVEYDFWPKLNEAGCNGCEPDVILRITETNGRKIILLIEAKYLSGKSSEADESAIPNDQLAREWDNLQLIAAGEGREPILLYLTAGLSFPSEDISASQKELETKRETQGIMCWLSWRHLYTITKNSNCEMQKDLSRLMEKMQLTFFHGFSLLTEITPINWQFNKNFEWEVDDIPNLTWRFDQ
jgi:hypothetical protein